MATPRHNKPDPRELLDSPDDVGDDESRTHTYPVRKLGNRQSVATTGVTMLVPVVVLSKVFWLPEVATKWIAPQHHPELLDNRLMRFCLRKNVQLVFIVLYKFDSQLIENVCRDVKSDVSRPSLAGTSLYPVRTITALETTNSCILYTYHPRILYQTHSQLLTMYRLRKYKYICLGEIS